MRNQIIPLVGILLLCSCSNNTTKNKDNQAITINNGIITLSDSSAIATKIKLERVEESLYSPQFSTSGVVKAIPTSYADIATPFAGRIVKSFVQLGQRVVKGSPLFELSSPAFFETAKTYFSAKQEMEQALKNLNREKDLFTHGVGVKKEVEEAEVNYQLKKQDYENVLSALKVFQVDPAKIALGKPLLVRSPISGKVVKNDIVIGQYIKEDSAPLLTIADLNKVWVVAHVKEKDIRLIERLQEVEVRLSASTDELIKGSVYHISEMLDEATRSVEVIIVCNNAEGRMKPNMYGTVQLTDKPTRAILVPTAAILQQEESNYVVVSRGNNKFEKVAVVVGDVIGDKSVIASGLTPGQEIITQGAFYLLEAK